MSAHRAQERVVVSSARVSPRLLIVAVTSTTYGGIPSSAKRCVASRTLIRPTSRSGITGCSPPMTSVTTRLVDRPRSRRGQLDGEEGLAAGMQVEEFATAQGRRSTPAGWDRSPLSRLRLYARPERLCVHV